MDPVSILGITSSTVALLKTILEASQGLQTTLRDIKSIDENTEGLVGEVDAFHLVLGAFQTELQTSKFIPEVHRWWSAAQLDRLLTNAKKTLFRLDAISKEVGKRRAILSALRQYWCSKGYDKEFQHLRLRIGTFITALRIPIELGRIHNIRQDLASGNPDLQKAKRETSSQRQMDSLAVQLLGDRVIQLEASIQTLSRNLESFQDQGTMVILPSKLRKQSEQLINIASTLAQSTASASAPISDCSSLQVPTVLQVEERDQNSVIVDDEIGYASSLYGVPIGPQARQRISAWISAISSTPAPTVKDVPVALSNLSLDIDPVASQFTAPSTIQRSLNLRAQLAEARFKKAQGYMAAEKFRKAIPLFKRSVQELESNPDHFNPDVTDRCLYMNLAKAMMKCEDHLKEVEPLLRSVLDHPESSPEEQSEAAQNLADLLSETDDTRLEEAKDLCQSAATIRAEIFGQDDPKTHRSFALITLICGMLHDPDEELWLDMLPESYELPPKLVRTLNLSCKENWKILRAMVSSSDGTLVANSYHLDIGSRTAKFDYVDRWNIPSEAAAWKEAMVADKPQSWKQLMEGDPTIALSPDGKLLVVANREGMDGTDSSPEYLSPEYVYPGYGYSTAIIRCHRFLIDATALAFSQDGTLFALAPLRAPDISLYQADPFQALPSGKVKTDLGKVNAIAFSPDNQLLALAGWGKDQKHGISLCNIKPYSVVWMLYGHGDEFTKMTFSPDGRLLATTDSSKKVINLLSSKSGELMLAIEGYPHLIYDMIFLSDGKVLRVVGLDKENRIQLREFRMWR